MTDERMNRHSVGHARADDDDVNLALDWLNGHVPPADEPALFDRYASDQAFAEIVDTWQAILEIPELPAVLAAALAREDAREGAQEDGRQPTNRDAVGESPWRRRTRRVFEMVNTAGAVYAAATVISLGIGYWALDEMTTPPTDIVVTTIPHRAPSAPVAGQQGTPQGAPQGAPTVVPQAVRPDSLRKSGAIFSVLDSRGVEIRADSGDDRMMDLPTGSRILVRAGSSVRYAPTPGRATGGNLEVRGEAAIHVSRRQLHLEVVSRAGVAQLLPGSYAVRCVDRCAWLEVAVDTGVASLSADWRNAGSVMVRAGQFGWAPRDGEAALVPADSARAFPRVEPSFRRLP